jgi:hypothetical protein
LPGGFVELDGFAVGQIAGVHLPCAIGQIRDGREARDDGLRLGLEVGGNFGGLFGGLRARAAGRKQGSGNAYKNGNESGENGTAMA